MSVVFFTDRDLGLQFPAILTAGGLTVERHGDHLKFIAEHEPPYIAKVYRPSPTAVKADPSATGRVELWYPK